MSRPSPQQNAKIKTLLDLGLNENEAVLYSLMLEIPQSTVQELAIRAPFPRTMLYHVLGQLSESGLVSQKKDKWRTVYIAEDPERLYEILAKKEKDFAQASKSVRTLIPKLKQSYSLAGKRTSVRSFDGIEDYKKALEDTIISKPKEIFAYETLGVEKSALDLRNAYNAKRITRKIKKKILFFENKKALDYIKARKYDDYTEFRSIKDGMLTGFDTDFMIYDGKILYTSHYDITEPSAILIEDAELYNMQKSLFESLWQSAESRTLAFLDVK